MDLGYVNQKSDGAATYDIGILKTYLQYINRKVPSAVLPETKGL
jgi:hypothetical protein